MLSYFDELKEELPKIIVVQEKNYDDRMKEFLDGNNYSLIWAGHDEEISTSIYRR